MGGMDNFLLSRAAIYWNTIATEAQRQDYSYAAPTAPEQPGPCYTARAMAIVHIAMHDAFISVTKEGETYLTYDNVPAFSKEGEPHPCHGVCETTCNGLFCLPCVFCRPG
jgi:hypothetical protein